MYTPLFIPVLSLLLFVSYFPYCPFVILSCGSINLKCNYLFIKQAFLRCFIVSSSFFTYFIGLISAAAFWPGWLSLDRILVDTKHCGWLVGFCLFVCQQLRSLLLYKYKIKGVCFLWRYTGHLCWRMTLCNQTFILPPYLFHSTSSRLTRFWLIRMEKSLHLQSPVVPSISGSWFWTEV